MKFALVGRRYQQWRALSSHEPKTFIELKELLQENRNFKALQTLNYGDHGLEPVVEAIKHALEKNQRIGLYADYDVDGTMSCVCWIWFLQAIGYSNFVYHIPCRFKEGYGLNLPAIERLIDQEKIELLVTMDTGITANQEAAYCRSRGVAFICTDHHKIQPEKIPDGLLLNPKFHPDPIYQELCGCGITFVLLRKLNQHFNVPKSLWEDLLALTGMATICDVVPLNGVNHRLAKLGVDALLRSQRPILKQLLAACRSSDALNESDVAFRLGPRINAVGRLTHAKYVIEAFIDNNPAGLVDEMERCNRERRDLQEHILKEARQQAKAEQENSFLFLGGEWHAGVVGIAASKLAEEYWRPVWLFQRGSQIGKGSARSIIGFDVTAAMSSCSHLFLAYGGHSMAGGFSFAVEKEDLIKAHLAHYVEQFKKSHPHCWQSQLQYDCTLSPSLCNLQLIDLLDSLRPFGHGFEQPKFRLNGQFKQLQFYQDKRTGKPRHSALTLQLSNGHYQKILFFDLLLSQPLDNQPISVVATASRNQFNGSTSLSWSGHDLTV